MLSVVEENVVPIDGGPTVREEVVARVSPHCGEFFSRLEVDMLFLKNVSLILPTPRHGGLRADPQLMTCRRVSVHDHEVFLDVLAMKLMRS